MVVRSIFHYVVDLHLTNDYYQVITGIEPTQGVGALHRNLIRCGVSLIRINLGEL